MHIMHRRHLFALGAGALAAPALARAQSLTNLADTMAGDNRFSRFLDLITRATMVEDFRQPQPMTVFAPVDDAFTGAPATALQDILTLGQQRGSGGGSSGDSSDRQRWVAFINYHVVPGAFRASELTGADRRLRTRNGGDVQISGTGGSLQLRNPAPAQQLSAVGSFGMNVQPQPAQVLGSEIVASNGVIYPISQVLFP